MVSYKALSYVTFFTSFVLFPLQTTIMALTGVDSFTLTGEEGSTIRALNIFAWSLSMFIAFTASLMTCVRRHLPGNVSTASSLVYLLLQSLFVWSGNTDPPVLIVAMMSSACIGLVLTMVISTGITLASTREPVYVGIQ